MARAQKASFASIMSSGATTVVGFFALIFMSYTMGADMGLVLAKGIFFSLLCVMLLLPVLAVLFVKIIDKTTHKPLLPSLKKVQHLLGGKVKYVVVGVLLVVSILSFMAQNKNEFMYSSSNIGDEKQTEMIAKIENTFGESNNFVVIVPRGSETAEYDMANKLESLNIVKSVQGIYAFIDPATPQEIVPDYLRDEFLSENYSRYIVEVDTPIESDASMDAVEEIRGVAGAYFEKAYVTGPSPVIYDIAQTTSGDFSLVTVLSIVFVGFIILLTFRSLTVPVILLFIIETSIWINMAIPYFQGTPMIFLGYMIISAIQLGATIDYAILMTNYYLEGRKTLDKRSAAEYAVEKAGASIMVSALVLAVGGFVIAGTFTLEAMAQMGTLIGRGAIFSGFLTIFVLPQLLITLDGVIKRTTLKGKLFKRGQQDEI
jgi:predicted RND superfamily exporter protein